MDFLLAHSTDASPEVEHNIRSTIELSAQQYFEGYFSQKVTQAARFYIEIRKNQNKINSLRAEADAKGLQILNRRNDVLGKELGSLTEIWGITEAHLEELLTQCRLKKKRINFW